MQPHTLAPQKRGPIADITGLIAWLALSGAVAVSGAAFEPGEWYALLEKPSWTPPNWLFPPVWTALYIAMAVAAWRVWRSGPIDRTWRPLFVYVIQLSLNALWSWLFFGEHLMGIALIDIVALWLAILATTVLFFKRDRTAGLLLVPYLAWVGYASALNFALWSMNQ